MYTPRYVDMQALSRPSTPLRSHTKPALTGSGSMKSSWSLRDAAAAASSKSKSPRRRAAGEDNAQELRDAVVSGHAEIRAPPALQEMDVATPNLSSVATPLVTPMKTTNAADDDDEGTSPLQKLLHESSDNFVPNPSTFQSTATLNNPPTTSPVSRVQVTTTAEPTSPGLHRSVSFSDLGSERGIESSASEFGLRSNPSLSDLLGGEAKAQLERSDVDAHARAFKKHMGAAQRRAERKGVPTSPYSQRYIETFLDNERKAVDKKVIASQYYMKLEATAAREREMALVKSPTVKGRIIPQKGDDVAEIEAFGGMGDRKACEVGIATRHYDSTKGELHLKLAGLMSRKGRRRSPRRGRGDGDVDGTRGASAFISAVRASATADTSVGHTSIAAANSLKKQREKRQLGSVMSQIRRTPAPAAVSFNTPELGRAFTFHLAPEHQHMIIHCMAFVTDTAFIANNPEFRRRLGWHRGDVVRVAKRLLRIPSENWQTIDFASIEWNVIHNVLTEVRNARVWPPHGAMPPLTDEEGGVSVAPQQPAPMVVSRRSIDQLHTDLLNHLARTMVRLQEHDAMSDRSGGSNFR